MFVIPAVACYPPPCQHQLSLALDLAWDTQVTKVGCHLAPEKKLETSYQKKKLPSAALFHHRESRPEIFLPKKSLWKRLESLSCLAIPMTSGMDDIISTSTDWRRTLVCQNWWVLLKNLQKISLEFPNNKQQQSASHLQLGTFFISTKGPSNRQDAQSLVERHPFDSPKALDISVPPSKRQPIIFFKTSVKTGVVFWGVEKTPHFRDHFGAKRASSSLSGSSSSPSWSQPLRSYTARLKGHEWCKNRCVPWSRLSRFFWGWETYHL